MDPDAIRKMLETAPANVEQRTDRFGNVYHVGNVGAITMPPFPIGPDMTYAQHAERIRNYELDDGDLLICSMQKAGLHWHEAIVQMLKRGSAEHAETTSSSAFLDFFSGQRPKTESGGAVVFTHLPFGMIPKQALEKKVKILYLTRNPKDVLVSFYSHVNNHSGILNFPGKFEHFYYDTMEDPLYYGHIFDYFLSFEKGMQEHPEADILESNYEDMKADPVGGVSRLNQFLGTGCSAALCADIAKACDFSTLRKVKDASLPSTVKAVFKPGAPTFYRKGEVGDWKNWFTVAMDEHYTAQWQAKMADFKGSFRYTL